MGGPLCGTLVPHEYVGQLEYEFILGNVQKDEIRRTGRPPQNDPPGTFWYHPHAHGSTHDQVSAGMAGFLIVEGDVDDAINLAMTGEAHPDRRRPRGADYRERLVFVQRVIVPSVIQCAGERAWPTAIEPAPVPAGDSRRRYVHAAGPSSGGASSTAAWMAAASSDSWS
jgi:hypothetical protein